MPENLAENKKNHLKIYSSWNSEAFLHVPKHHTNKSYTQRLSMCKLVKLLICLIMYKQISMFLKDAHEIQKLQLVKL
jgi:hypothetical protein